MRFAWLRKKASDIIYHENRINLTRLPYNAAWLLPIILTAMGEMDYGTGFIIFAAITFIRLGMNAYRVNALELEQAVNFPFQA